MNMNSLQNIAYGKKIFFLNPPFTLVQNVIGKLRDNEYELYIIDSYKNAKNVLRLNPDSVCFLNIDDELPLEQWVNFINSFKTDPMLQSVLLGVISSKIRNSEKEYFLVNVSLPAGFTSLHAASDEIATHLADILDINEAKGQRRYVRVCCEDEDRITMLYNIQDKVYTLRIRDISAAGFSAIIPAKYTSFYQPNFILRNLTLALDSKQYECCGAVYALRPAEAESEAIIVVLFLKGISVEMKQSIRKFTFAKHQAELKADTKSLPQDETDYSKKPADSVSETDDAFLIDYDEAAENEAEALSAAEEYADPAPHR